MDFKAMFFIRLFLLIIIGPIFFMNHDAFSQIIINHTSVDLYSKIPDYYIAEVKKMWLNLPGESHARAYRIGVNLLASLEPKYAVVTTETAPPTPYRTDALRVSGLVRNQYNNWDTGAGEEDWYTNADGIARIKNHITYCNTHNLEITAIGFGWCWDMTHHNPPGGGVDPVYNVRWAGSSVGGPQGDMRWGLDDEDTALTGNTINMNTYLNATQGYADYCTFNGYKTRVLFTTGPVDGFSGESGYQRHLKHEYIRNYVKADKNRILFDYADILAHNNSGIEYTLLFNGKPYQMIHPDNMKDLDGGYVEDGDHIGQVGALRLAKAIWVLMARLAGWNPDRKEKTDFDGDYEADVAVYRAGTGAWYIYPSGGGAPYGIGWGGDDTDRPLSSIISFII